MEKKWREFKGKRREGKEKIGQVNEGVSKRVEEGRGGGGGEVEENLKGRGNE